MYMENTTSVLAAFATLKTLNYYNNYSSPYQLLSEFINYIICEKEMYTFTTIEMKNQLGEVFGFNIPEAVVKSASKILPFASREKGVFIVDKEQLKANDKFYELIDIAKNDNNSIISRITQYILEAFPDKKINQNDLTLDLIAFLIEDNYKSTGKYANLISEFVLKHEYDDFVKSGLDAIREGSILYIGINHNINETGSLKKQLVLFLDVEVLFSLVGYNGEVYRTLAEDLYNQVRIANQRDKKVSLRYFYDTKREIENFFGTAESIVAGKMKLSNKPAMKKIVNGCSTITDVQIKKSDFFHTLQSQYGILQDEENDYYREDLKKYNLESDEYSDEAEQESWKFISHINKLRKGKKFDYNLDSEYLFVTNTYSTLNASKTQSQIVKEEEKMDFICDFAVTVDKMTNILWYKLGNGFGCKSFPNNVNIILKARLVLASNISTNIDRVYNETMQQHKLGEITDEQLAARIITLRTKPVFPEELEGDNIEDSMNFSSEYLSRYEEEVKSNKQALQEKEKIIETLKEQKEIELTEKEKTIEAKEQLLQEKEKENKNLERELNIYRQKEEKKERIKKWVVNILLFLWAVIWRVGILCAVAFMLAWIDEKTEFRYFKYLTWLIDVVCISLALLSLIKSCKTKYFYNENDAK